MNTDTSTARWARIARYALRVGAVGFALMAAGAAAKVGLLPAVLVKVAAPLGLLLFGGAVLAYAKVGDVASRPVDDGEVR